MNYSSEMKESLTGGFNSWIQGDRRERPPTSAAAPVLSVEPFLTNCPDGAVQTPAGMDRLNESSN